MYRPTRIDPDGDATAKRLRALSRIRKLLRLAEDQDGQPEGRAARKRALALMESHGLSMSSVDLKGEADFRSRAFELGAKEAWRRTLVHAIADYFDCVALYEKGATEAQTYGPEVALPQVEYTFVVYMRQLQRAWARHTQDMKDVGVWQPLSHREQLETRESFCVSFVLGVKERLEADREAEKREDPRSHAASMRQRRDLDRWMRRAGVRWRARPTGVGSLNSEGFRAGLEAEVDAGLGGRGGPRRITG